MRLSLYTIALAFIALYTSGCAGSAFDRNFRARVESVTISEGVQIGAANIGISQTFHYRLPELAKK